MRLQSYRAMHVSFLAALDAVQPAVASVWTADNPQLNVRLNSVTPQPSVGRLAVYQPDLNCPASSWSAAGVLMLGVPDDLVEGASVLYHVIGSAASARSNLDVAFFMARCVDNVITLSNEQVTQPRLLPGVAGLEDAVSTDCLVALRDDQDTGAHNHVIAGVRFANHSTGVGNQGPVHATMSCRRYTSTIPVLDPYML